MRRFVSSLLLVSAAAGTLAAQQQAGNAIQYPPTRKVDTVANYHGTRIPDPYRWMESIETAEVTAWAKSQNAITLPYLASLPGRDLFQARITSLFNYARSGTPWFEGGRWYYSKNSGLQRQNVYYSRATLDGPESLVLDPNQLSPDGSVALSGFYPSPDGKYLAYGQSEGGSDWITFYIRDLATGRNTADTIRWVKFSGASWTNDGRGFFYSRYPAPVKGEEIKSKLEHQSIYYHRLGTPQSSDVKIYARPDNPKWYIFGGVDESGRYFFVSTSGGTDKNELYVADLGDAMRPNIVAPIKPIVTGHDANYNWLGVTDGRIYMQIDKDAPNRKIVAAPVATADNRATWQTIIPEGDLPIEGASMIAGRIGVLSLQDVASVVRLYSLDGKLEREVPMPGLGSASGLVGRFDRPELFFSFSSPTSPATVYRYDAASNTSRAFNAPKLTFDPTQFTTERVFYNSKDGTRVPMFITYRKNLVKNGANPTLLYAYGGFSISSRPGFSASVISWLEQGGVYAVANLRGGGEYGEKWHEAGMLEKKQNVFDDFIAAAEYLIREKYTSSANLAIRGGSNGGLLVGAVMTQRPELYAAAIPQVGVMDMLRYDEFSAGHGWAVEYGSSKDPKAFQYLRAYSPLHNIKPGVCYPATLVTTADHDDRVVPSHSYKFTATMQPAQASAPNCRNPVLIRIEMQGSHGYRPLDRTIAEQADMWAFAARHTGMKVQPSPVTP
jgi:prolyl oligopeptidase